MPKAWSNRPPRSFFLSCSTRSASLATFAALQKLISKCPQPRRRTKDPHCYTLRRFGRISQETSSLRMRSWSPGCLSMSNAMCQVHNFRNRMCGAGPIGTCTTSGFSAHSGASGISCTTTASTLFPAHFCSHEAHQVATACRPPATVLPPSTICRLAATREHSMPFPT